MVLKLEKQLLGVGTSIYRRLHKQQNVLDALGLTSELENRFEDGPQHLKGCFFVVVVFDLPLHEAETERSKMGSFISHSSLVIAWCSA